MRAGANFLFFGLLMMASLDNKAFSDNPDTQDVLRRNRTFTRCFTGVIRPNPSDPRPYLLKRTATVSSNEGIMMIVDSDGTPHLRIYHQETILSLRNITSVQAEEYWGQTRRRKALTDGVRTFDFHAANQKVQLDFQFEKNRIKRFRVRTDSSKRSKTKLNSPFGKAPIFIDSGGITPRVKDSWYEVK